jgi:glutathione S-transferase
LFNAALPEEALACFRARLARRFDLLQDVLDRQEYLAGASFSVADAYLFTVLGWCRFFSIDLGHWAALQGYVQRVGARRAVLAALRAEAAP